MKNVYACTEIVGVDYPGFVSINESLDGGYAITVRSRGNAGRDIAMFNLSRTQLQDLAKSVIEKVAK